MWDDLFRAAAGEDNLVEPQAQTVESQDSTRKRQSSFNTENQRQKKGKKKSKKNHSQRSSQDILERVLESRTDPIDRQVWSSIPTWLSPGSSMCNSKRCIGWDQDDSCPLNSKCRNCGRSILHHSLAISPTVARKRNNIRMVLTAFALVRDIRCCCSCLVNEFYGIRGDRVCLSNLGGYIISATRKSNELVRMDFSSILNAGEADILLEKFQKIKRVANALQERVQRASKSVRKNKRRFKPGDVFDKIVGLIICCDAAYFRMYYLQNSGNLPIENEEVFLPHPPTYFGSENIAWEVFDYTADLLNTSRKANSQISDGSWNDLVDELGIARLSCKLDPLSFMQRNRQSESILLFRKTLWRNSKETISQFMECIKHKSEERDLESSFYATHETPAPAILRDWRDSCRDFLCNLYAYATLSPDMIDEIKYVLRENRIFCDSVVEIGAGTGYVAHLLRKAGFSVTAFDIAPTTSGEITSNEYHGSSPPFCPVEYADSNDLGSLLGQTKTNELALLLCYPPPLSDMAEASLQSFIKMGGSIFIHIGEFSGLTGSSNFEQFLGCNFDLEYRRRCLNWGTDTAEVTIWTKSGKARNVHQNLLLRCSQSKASIATQRLRICRPLSYSTAASFDAHKLERGLHFAFNMIPDALNTSDFISFNSNREKYFESLPCKNISEQ